MESAAVLAQLKPDVLACGHGRPMTGAGTAERLTSFSAAYGQKASRLSDPYTSRITANLSPSRCRRGQRRPVAEVSEFPS